MHLNYRKQLEYKKQKGIQILKKFAGIEIKDIDMLGITNERQREEIMKKALRTCDVRQWVRVIKTVYERKQKRQAQGKKVTAGDERCLHAARENLYGELAVSLGIEKNDVERYIMEKMEDKITG